MVKGSGFDDVYLSGMIQSGSLQGVLSGSHYNRAWTIHQSFGEALERILLKRFCYQCAHVVPDDFCHMVTNINEENMNTLTEETKGIFVRYKQFRDDIRKGRSGKTPQF